MKSKFFLICLILVLGKSYGQRIIRTENSGWTFTSSLNAEERKVVNLPHTWNAEDAITKGGDYYRGVATYQKNIFVGEEWKDKRLYLKFEGVNQVASLFLNDKLVGKHIGGYTGFVFDISDFVTIGSNNHIRLECDNSYNADVPPLSADFTFYGGAYRDVYLVVTNPVHFSLEDGAGLLIRTPELSENNAKVHLTSNVKNYLPKQANVMADLTIFSPDNKIAYSGSKSLNLAGTDVNKVDFEFNVDNPDLWSPESPNLYRAELKLIDMGTQDTLDAVSEDFGCRWFSVDPEKGFFLNGKAYRLMGVSRHQDYAGLGNALPNKIHETDLKMIKDMGSNFIRLAHYPQDPAVYEWCDKLGIIVWSEIPIVNQITESPSFFENCLQMQKENVLQNINHPSVMMWGYMNEVFLRLPFNRQTTQQEKDKYVEAAVELARQLNQETKDLDPSRLTVMALHQSQLYNTSGIADIPDIIGWNLYMGWYGGKMEQLGEFLDKEHREHPKRPVLISEYGPGADIRIQTDNPYAWDYSEAYQIDMHASYVDQVFERPYVVGMAAWNFADFGSASRVDAIPAINQKGLLTFDRIPKDIYYYYQSRLLQKPFVYLSGEHRQTYYCKEDSTGMGTVNLYLFSNCENVHLVIDGKDEFTTVPENGVSRLKLQLDEGTHTVTASADGESFSRQLDVKFRSNLLNGIDIEPLAVNVGSLCDFTSDITNETWIADQPYTAGGWGYVDGEVYQKSRGRVQGTDQDIKGTSEDPLYQTMREGLTNYRFDVKPGVYRISLLMTDPNGASGERLVYDLGQNQNMSKSSQRRFNILVNGKPVSNKLDLAGTYGYNYGVNLDFVVETRDGINIQFESIEGKPVLSAIRIKKESGQ